MPWFKIFLALAFACLVGCKADAFIELHDGETARGTESGALVMSAGDTLDFEVYAITTGFETQGWSCDNDDPKEELTSSDDTIATVVGPHRLHTKVTVNGQDVFTDVFTVVAIREGDVMLHSNCGGAEGSLRIRVKER